MSTFSVSSMSRRSFLAAAGLFSVSTVAALTGCSNAGTPAGSASAGSAAAGSSTKTLTVAMELAYPPFEGKDDAGNPSGVSVTFMEDFAAAYGYDLTIENVSFDGLIPSLQTGKADAVMSSITITPSARKRLISPTPMLWRSSPFSLEQIRALRAPTT